MDFNYNELAKEILSESTNPSFENRENDQWAMDKFNEAVAEQEKRLKKYIENPLDNKYKSIQEKDFIITKENEESYNKMMYLADNFKTERLKGKWYVIKGHQGTGKTMIKNIVLKKIRCLKSLDRDLHYRISMESMTLYSLYLLYLDSMKNGETLDLLQDFGNYDLLVIDEIGRRESTSALKDFLFELMERRYNNEKPTILISNLASVKDYIDEDRLKEVGVLCPMTGESFRGKK